MKRVLAILLLVPFIMVMAPPCLAAGNGEVTVSLVDIPAELQERSVLITLGSGPNDTDTVLVTLNGLNQYRQTVTLPEGTYYCNAAVQYDALMHISVQERRLYGVLATLSRSKATQPYIQEPKFHLHEQIGPPCRNV